MFIKSGSSHIPVTILASLSMSLTLVLVRFVTLSFGFVLVSFAASTKHYELGTLYTYDYALGLELNEPTTQESKTEGSAVGYKILSSVQVRPVWQQSLSNSILEVKVSKHS